MGDEQKFETLRQNKEVFIDKKKTIDLGSEEGYDLRHSSSENLRTSLQERTDSTSYADRTEYYFASQDLLEAKVDKYSRMGADEGGAISDFAKMHDNHSARKRKHYSKDAASSFKKALDQENKFNEEGKSPADIYKNRAKIMGYRLDGMKKAAKAKSTSPENEAYRVAKATISCYTELKSQLQNLLGATGGAEYEKILKKLDKEIDDAEKTLLKHTKSVEEKWKEGNGLDDPKVVAAKLAEQRKDNPDFTEDALVVMTYMNQFVAESNRPEFLSAVTESQRKGVFRKYPGGAADRLNMFVCHYIKRDANGQPINKEEQEKEEWNHKWLEAISDETKEAERREMMLKVFEEYEKIELPPFEELKEKGPMYFLEKDPFGFYELIHKATTLDNLKDADPFAEAYIKAHPLLDAKARYMATIANCLSPAIIVAHGVQWIGVGDKAVYKAMKKDNLKASAGDYKMIVDDMIGNTLAREKEGYDEVAKTLATVKSKNVPLSIEEIRQQNDTVTDESYELYKTITKENTFANHPEIIMAYKKTLKNPTFTGNATEWNLSRQVGLLMHNVHYDENWVPLTEEDARLHQDNLDRLKAFEVGDQEKIEQILRDSFADVKKFLDDFEFPTPEQLKEGWFIDLMKNEPAKAAMVSRVGLQLDNFVKISSFAKGLMDADPEVDAKALAISRMINYETVHCGVTMGLDVQLMENCKIMKKDDQEGFPPEVMATYVDVLYREAYENLPKKKDSSK